MRRSRKNRATKYLEHSHRRKSKDGLKGLTAVELGKKIQAKEVTVKEAVEACFAQIDKVEKEVNSFVSFKKKLP